MGHNMSGMQVEDIQGLLLRGYGALKGARYLGLRMTESRAAKQWLRALQVRDAREKPSESETCVNVAFSAAGLAQLELPAHVREQFAPEFQQGMAGTEHRQRLLGDVDLAEPSQWRWGGPDNPEIHALLMLFAQNEGAVEVLAAQHRERLARAAIEVVVELDTQTLPGFKEHFGFRDGISQPQIAGWDAPGPEHNQIAAGEFVLGYDNAYGQLVERPLMAAELDPEQLLPPAPDQPARRDLGMNGSYLVFRQLDQDVRGFWDFIAQKAERDDLAARTRLAAKMVGRWPEGAPLVKAPHAPSPALSSDNDFLYVGSDDAHGFKCPIGAHVRRTNPRDALDPEPGSERSIEVGKRHRILRRGRTFGPPLAASMSVADLTAAARDGAGRGLHFICFNTHIGRQFEFIQHTWVNSPKFDGLYAEDDPVIGPRKQAQNAPGGTFTMQAHPVRRRVTDLPRFVIMRGGGYFFLPGLRALRFLAASG